MNGTIEERAAAVNNNLNGKQPIKLASEKAAVTSFNKDWAFTHHPGLTYFKGKWYASFSQGFKDEDAPGQRVVVCSNEDFFHWSEPVVIGPCTENTLVPGKLSANVPSPIWTNGEKLFITYGAGSYGADKFDKNGNFIPNSNLDAISIGYVVSSEDGKTWTDLYPTNFGSCFTMWKFGELPDGCIYGIGTSGDRYTSRNKLEMWISEDGVNFDTCYILRDEADPQQQQDGWAKGGNYGYPSV